MSSVRFVLRTGKLLHALPSMLTTYTQRVKARALPGEPTVKIDDADARSAGGVFSVVAKRVAFATLWWWNSRM